MSEISFLQDDMHDHPNYMARLANTIHVIQHGIIKENDNPKRPTARTKSNNVTHTITTNGICNSVGTEIESIVYN